MTTRGELTKEDVEKYIKKLMEKMKKTDDITEKRRIWKAILRAKLILQRR